MFKWKRDKISLSTTDTFIGEGTIVEGAIRSAGSVRLDGQLRGDLFCEGDVVLGESAFAISNITARNVTLAGQVTGNVRISGKLTIASTGKLYGDLNAATITIEEGGVFQGNSTMDMGEPLFNPLERRSSRERRKAADPNWKGEERRSGYDRRESGLFGPVLKKINYRAPETAGDVTNAPEESAAEYENETTGNIALDGQEALAASADPLRESGRAFFQSMNGNCARAEAGAPENPPTVSKPQASMESMGEHDWLEGSEPVDKREFAEVPSGSEQAVITDKNGGVMDTEMHKDGWTDEERAGLGTPENADYGQQQSATNEAILNGLSSNESDDHLQVGPDSPSPLADAVVATDKEYHVANDEQNTVSLDGWAGGQEQPGSGALRDKATNAPHPEEAAALLRNW